MDKTLYTQDGVEIPKFEITAPNFLNQTLALYGPTKSGKTVYMKDTLNALRDSISMCILISSSEQQQKVFSKLIPSELTYYEFSIDVIKKIYERQEAAKVIYDKVNDIAVLENLYNRVKSKEFMRQIMQLDAMRDKYILQLKREGNDSISIIKKADKMKEVFTNMKSVIYKKCISYNERRLKSMSLSEPELYSLKYLYFNPNIVLILDDCSEQIKKYQNHPVLKSLFFRGRHCKITLMLAVQDDKELPSEIKKNIFKSIFTTAKVANAFIGRASQNFEKDEQKEAKKIIQYIYKDSKIKHLMLAYDREDIENPFRCTVAQEQLERRFGAPLLHIYCQKIRKDGYNNLNSNYKQLFSV